MVCVYGIRHDDYVWSIPIEIDRQVASQPDVALAPRRRADTKSQRQAGKLRAGLEVSVEFDGWAADARLHGLPKNVPRVNDILNLNWATQLKDAPRTATRESLAKGFWGNPGQMLNRHPKGKHGGPGTMTSKSLWYSFEYDICPDGVDLLRVQGIPADVVVNGLSDTKLRELAGESYSCPIITLISMAWYHQPWGLWWKQS